MHIKIAFSLICHRCSNLPCFDLNDVFTLLNMSLTYLFCSTLKNYVLAFILMKMQILILKAIYKQVKCSISGCQNKIAEESILYLTTYWDQFYCWSTSPDQWISGRTSKQLREREDLVTCSIFEIFIKFRLKNIIMNYKPDRSLCLVGEKV